MSFYLYILYSRKFNRTYTGQTDNVDERLIKHNSGKVRSTKYYKPWVIIHTEMYNSRSEAMKRERWFKTSAGKKKITNILNSYLNRNS